LQSRKSAVIIGIAAVAAMAIIIAFAISMIPEAVRKEGESPTGNNKTSGAESEEEVSREYKIRTTTGSINSPYAIEYKLLNGTWPSGTMVDGKGNVWTVGSQSHALVKFDPATGTVKSYPLPDAGAGSIGLVWSMIEAKEGGSIWFSGFGGKNPLWRFDPDLEKFEKPKKEREMVGMKHGEAA
jgi:streptogramin lyase